MAHQSTLKSLRDIALFCGLDDTERTALESQCAWREAESGALIITQADTSTDVFFVVSGRVRAVLYSAAGKEVALREIGPGEMFGEYSAIDGEPRSATIEALESCLVAVLPAAGFQAVVARHPDISMQLVQVLLRQIRTLTARVFEFSTLAVSNRIHAELLRLARASAANSNTTPAPNAAVIDPAPTHADIASQISTHREAVTRELTKLSKIGLVERQGGALRVTDVARLTTMVNEALGE